MQRLGAVLGGGAITPFADTGTFMGGGKLEPVTNWDEAIRQTES